MSPASPEAAGARVTLRTRAGERVAAWRTPAPDARRAGLVIVHALWGVTPHIRALCAEWAEHGYETLAPSLLDGAETAFPERNLNPAQLHERAALAEASEHGAGVLDRVQAAVDALEPPVMVIGFCFGGTTAWLAAARCEGVAAVACFYGGHIIDCVEEAPRCPAILHFGRRDPLIPPADIERLVERWPDLPIHVYDAGHAFMAPSDFHPDSARLATLRTLQLFHRAAGARGEIGG